MAYMKEKKQHEYLINLLKKHFDEDEVEEAMRDLEGDDDYSEEVSDEDEMEDIDGMELPEELEAGEEEDMDLSKDKRKGLAVVIIQKRMSKPKKDMY